MSRESALNFDQWKAFSQNYKAIKIWLWIVNKITENNCRPQLFAEFI